MRARLVLLSAGMVALACSVPVYRGQGLRCVGGDWSAGVSSAGPGPMGTDQNGMMRVIESYMGTPYVYGGNGHDGIDCSGFTQAVYRESGFEIPRTASAQAEFARDVSPSELQFGDLLFFNTSGSGISHVGIFLGNGFFAHAASSSGVRRESLANPYYAARIVGAGRVPGM